MPIENWDDLRVFAIVARTGRMAAAGRDLGLDHSTVVRRIARLEKAMGTHLFDRSPSGVRLTASGTELIGYVERMEGDAHAAERRLGGVDRALEGVVRLATPEAFGTYLVAPNIRLLTDRHPGLQLELVPESRSVNITKREADLAVALAAPPRGRLFARRLTDYRIGLYAAADYLEQHGPIDTQADLARHPFVWYIDELIDVPQLRYLDQLVADARTIFRASTLSAQQAAVVAGAGLGILHSFAARTEPRLVPVLEDAVSVVRSYWLILHADQRTLPRIRAVAEFLDELVALQRGPLG